MKPQVMLTKLLFHLVAILPLIGLIYAVNFNQLSADPAKDIQHFTGITTLRLLVIVSLIPLIAQLSGWTTLFQVRKLLGLWCFCWATLHLSSYLLLEIGWGNIAFFFSEIFSRTYLVIGLASWFILFLMALSSFEWVRVNLVIWWKRVHALFYPVLLLVILHYILSLKTLTPEPFVYLMLILLSYMSRFIRFGKAK
ncbi:protein-methionine-sulfoxide reductase heme-binding subunit MsrQ [Providencia sp.]